MNEEDIEVVNEPQPSEPVKESDQIDYSEVLGDIKKNTDNLKLLEDLNKSNEVLKESNADLKKELVEIKKSLVEVEKVITYVPTEKEKEQQLLADLEDVQNVRILDEQVLDLKTVTATVDTKQIEQAKAKYVETYEAVGIWVSIFIGLIIGYIGIKGAFSHWKQ